MTGFDVCLVFIVLISVIFNKQENKKEYIILSMTALAVILALRNKMVGSDTLGYYRKYKEYGNSSLFEMIDLYKEKGFKDPTYYFAGWIFSRVFKDPQWWFAAVAAFYCYSVGMLIYRESKVPTISVIMFIALEFYWFAMSGVRQTIALGITVMAYTYIKEKRPVRFVICVLLASLFHQSALIFLIAYPLARTRIGIYHFLVALAVFVVFFMFREKLTDILSSWLQEDRYQEYFEQGHRVLTMSGFLIKTAVFVYAMVYYKKVVKMDQNNEILYNMSFFGLMFQLFAVYIAEMFRVSLYFSIYNIILIANASVHEDEYKNRLLFQIALFMIALMYFYKDGAPYYKFFWQT